VEINLLGLIITHEITLRFFYGFEKNMNIWVEVITVAQPKQDKIVLHEMILQLFPSH
jgi:hypothetical protein